VVVSAVAYLCLWAVRATLAWPPGLQYTAANVTQALAALSGLLLIAFWRDVWKFMENRGVTLNREGFSVSQPSVPAEPLTGSVRDNFIYLGLYYYGMCEPGLAYQHFAAADRMTGSILTAFRCMQSLASVSAAGDDALVEYYDRALWHALHGGPANLKDRTRFAEWVLARRHRRFDPDFPQALRTDLQQVRF